MKEQWQELKETIIELRDNDGTSTQQEVCKFLANLMDVLEKQMQEPCDDAISRQAALKFTCDDCKHSDSCVNAQNGYKYPNCAYSLRQLPRVTQKSGKRSGKE